MQLGMQLIHAYWIMRVALFVNSRSRITIYLRTRCDAANENHLLHRNTQNSTRLLMFMLIGFPCQLRHFARHSRTADMFNQPGKPCFQDGCNTLPTIVAFSRRQNNQA